MPHTPLIAWDFDGVLNRNMEGGRFRWAAAFERELGMPIARFVEVVFGNGFDAVITGQQDLRARVALWAEAEGYAPGPDALLDFWFRTDAYPDDAMLALMEEVRATGARQVIATNNEPRRAAYIEGPLGFGARVETVFASGRMGLRKPDPAYFRHIAQATETPPSHLLLVDDTLANVTAARAVGWSAIHMPEGSQADVARQVRDWLALF